jgi:hypothetical protein
MVDFFALGLIHALLALAAVRLMLRDELDRDPPQDSQRPDQSGD